MPSPSQERASRKMTAPQAPNPRVQLQSPKESGHDFWIPESFEAEQLQAWRLASFTIVLPIPNEISLVEPSRQSATFIDDVDPLSRYGWKLGRDKGIRLIENPEWDSTKRVFRKPGKKTDWYGRQVVHGGDAWYYDSRRRFLNPVARAIGTESVDLDVARNEKQAGDLVPLLELNSDHNLTAHHFLPEPEKDVTWFELTNYDEQVPWADQLRSRKDERGPSYLRFLSFEILQYREPDLSNFDGPTPQLQETTGNFLLLNIAAENVSHATLGFLSATLSKPWDTSQVYLDGQGDKTDLEQLSALRWFCDIAINEIDSKLGRKKSMLLDDSGRLVPTNTTPIAENTFQLPAPQKVAMAIPNPCSPMEAFGSDKEAQDELTKGSVSYEFYGGRRSILPQDQWERGINGTVGKMEGPLLLTEGRLDHAWTWQKQWAWQISIGADSYPEHIPLQSDLNLAAMEAGSDQTWSVLTTSEGVGLVRSISASKEGMSYWSLAHTRLVDVLVLNMRARAGEAHLRSSLRTIAAISNLNRKKLTSIDQRESLQKDLLNLEYLQFDHIEIRDNLWFRNIPEREIETKVLRGLQKASEFDQLRDDFEEKLRTRQRILETRFDQVAGTIREEEAEVSERTNMILGIIAAAIGAPDWAAAAGYPDNLGASLLAFLATILLFGVLVKLISFSSHRLGR